MSFKITYKRKDFTDYNYPAKGIFVFAPQVFLAAKPKKPFASLLKEKIHSSF
ncbi:MAG: hypothetical protein RBR64_09100 [Bacteroidales bacterium]|nr:hypothetical protein [Bacteroidales bacterium]